MGEEKVNNIGKLLVTEFVDENIDYLEKVVTSIQNEPMSFNRKTRMVHGVMMKGISYGIDKGGFIERCRKGKVEAAVTERYRKWKVEFFNDLEEDIEANIKRTKYKKVKKKN